MEAIDLIQRSNKRDRENDLERSKFDFLEERVDFNEILRRKKVNEREEMIKERDN
jgi:hypothetical protein